MARKVVEILVVSPPVNPKDCSSIIPHTKVDDTLHDARKKLIVNAVKRLIRLGNFKKAEVLLAVALEDAPQNPYLLNSSTQIALRRGDLDEAEQRSQRELQANPNNPVAYYMSIKILGIRSPSRAINDIIEILQNKLAEPYIYLLAFFVDKSASVWKVIFQHLDRRIQEGVQKIWGNRDAIIEFEFEAVNLTTGHELWELGGIPINRMAGHEFNGQPENN